MDETTTAVIADVIIEDSAHRRIELDDGHLDLYMNKWTDGSFNFKIEGNGTSSCVDRIQALPDNTIVVVWSGKAYTYEVKDSVLVLAEFLLHLSLGKTANWVKKNNIMPIEVQEALKS
ncbi:MAG: hypothetical protein HOF71_05395 [Chloroflexi bacterium]|jgi:hypothetical protein|nr:hypothetical protein [Chloroflexota bacterium]